MTFKNQVKHLLGRWPVPFGIAYRLLPRSVSSRELLFDRDTELVIEGFPRSGNTFAVTYFQMAQQRPVRVAHHLHVECQLKNAAAYGVPGIVLVREPESCIRSLLVRERTVTLSGALRRYIGFYGSLLPCRDKLLVVPFERAVNDMAVVIHACNRKYGTTFDAGVHDDRMKELVFAEISAINARVSGGKSTHVSKPDKNRSALAESISFLDCQDLLRKANSTYSSFLSSGALW